MWRLRTLSLALFFFSSVANAQPVDDTPEEEREEGGNRGPSDTPPDAGMMDRRPRGE